MSCDAVSRSLISVATTVSSGIRPGWSRGEVSCDQFGGHCCECGKDVRPELLGVVVSRVEGQPGGGALAGEPVSHQGGLAETSGRRYQGQRRVPTPCGAGPAVEVGPRGCDVGAVGAASWSAARFPGRPCHPPGPSLSSGSLAARRGADVGAFAGSAEEAEDLDGLIAGCAEPVGYLGVELGDLAGLHREVVAAEQ